MKYDVNKIKDSFNKSNKMEFVFFWGHREGQIITKACFSQWYLCEFTVDGVVYNCAEKFMMAEKARLFNDFKTLDKILATSDQSKIKELGRQVKNFDEELWDREKYNIVLKGNIAKFSQNESLKRFLVSTKDKILVEASPYDKVWGIGLKADDKNTANPYKWRGENLLGFALMEVRDILK